FLMPSRVIEKEGSFEGFGIVFLEASFFKKFLIGAKTGGIPEAIINGETGILLDDPEDYIKLSEIIKDYFKNPYKYEKIKENAYKRVLKEFDIKKLIRDYEKKLFEILK
ncbi:MAG: glycosyltransferase, partial [candidate division WOR-3 bacterium]